jgi:CheY-like chemotaxis protein
VIAVGGSETLAHDLRSPLTSIVSYVDLLRGGGAGSLTDEQEAMLAVVARNAGRLMDLLDEQFPPMPVAAGPEAADEEPVRSVVVCDDTDDIRLFLEMLLTREGYDVIATRTGEEGLETVLRTHPDMVILDVGLPGMDGWQVLSGIRTMSTVPIVMLTGHSSEEDKAHGARGGADAYVTKPFDNTALLETIRGFLGDSHGAARGEANG